MKPRTAAALERIGWLISLLLFSVLLLSSFWTGQFDYPHHWRQHHHHHGGTHR